MKNEIKAFKKLIENQTAFEYFKNSVNIFANSKIEKREELAEYVENHHTSDQLEKTILDYLAGRRVRIEKVNKNIDQKGRGYVVGGSVIFVKIGKLEALKNEIMTILNESVDLDLEIVESFYKTTNHPDPKRAAEVALITADIEGVSGN
jgi:hypothetical protein